MAHVLDRWTVPGPPGANGRPTRVRGPRYGVGRRWAAVWTEADGSRRKRACATKDEATALIHAVEVQQRTGTYIPADRARITVHEMAHRWLAEQVHQRATSVSSIDGRLRNTILPTLGRYEIADVDRTVIQRAVTAWSQNLAPSTVRVAYVYLAGIFALAVDERRLLASPCRRINLPPVEYEPVIPMTVAQVQALTDGLWAPYRRMAVLAVATGMRSGELRGLTWDRVTVAPDGATAMLRVDRQLTGKSATHPVWGPLKTDRSVRVLSIGKATLDVLGEPGEGLVIRTARGGAVNRQRASDAWRHAAAPLSLPARSGWHDLRHFHASLLIAQGSSPVAVAHRLGHKDATETLKTYAHLWPDDDERMRDATDGIVTMPEHP